MTELIPQEDFEPFKLALRLAGFIPNKKLYTPMWAEINNELGTLSLGQIDEHCFQEKLEIEDERREEGNSLTRRLKRYTATMVTMASQYLNEGKY